MCCRLTLNLVPIQAVCPFNKREVDRYIFSVSRAEACDFDNETVKWWHKAFDNSFLLNWLEIQLRWNI